MNRTGRRSYESDLCHELTVTVAEEAIAVMAHRLVDNPTSETDAPPPAMAIAEPASPMELRMVAAAGVIV